MPIQWALHMSYMAQGDVPHTYKDAMNHSDSNAWLEACQDKLLSLWETQTYVPMNMDEIEVPNIVGCQWVFPLKRGLDGLVECHKARIVAKGFSQSYLV